MDKIAELVRDSEIRGAVAAFVDAGLVKVASVDAFDDLADTVAQVIGDEPYDIQKVAAVTDYVVTYDAEMQKRAGVGEVFGKAKKWVSDKAKSLNDWSKKNTVTRVMRGQNIRDAANARRSSRTKADVDMEHVHDEKKLTSNLRKEIAKTVAADTAAIGGIGALAYGGKKGYDHYRNR